jgi:hypothetical protein
MCGSTVGLRLGAFGALLWFFLIHLNFSSRTSSGGSSTGVGGLEPPYRRKCCEAPKILSNRMNGDLEVEEAQESPWGLILVRWLRDGERAVRPRALVVLRRGHRGRGI